MCLPREAFAHLTCSARALHRRTTATFHAGTHAVPRTPNTTELHGALRRCVQGSKSLRVSRQVQP